MTKLPKDIAKRIDAAELAVEDLRDAVQAHYDSKSDRWQRSDDGQEWLAWLDRLEDAIGQVNDHPGERA